MEHKLANAERELLEELVELMQIRGLLGENGGLKEFLDQRNKCSSSLSHDDLVAFLATFKKKQDMMVLQRHANNLLIRKFKEESPNRDTPEQDWFISDIGMNMSKAMKSTEMVAVDCEMVLCEDGSEGLVRVGVVDRNLNVILDGFVKPHKAVVDYRTVITGVTFKDIEKATLCLADIQRVLQPFLSNGAILVGHSLEKDMKVLKVDHPRVIDTSFVFKYANEPNRRRPSLNNLCKSILGYEIQKVGVAHNCVHDAAAAMKLALAVIEKGVDTTFKPTKEMLEAEKSRLFVHRIPHSVTSQVFEQALARLFRPRVFTLDFKPAKTMRGYSCAVVVFDSSVEANKAFENLDGNQHKDSLGLSTKLVVVEQSSGSRASFYVRKMVKDG